MSGYPDTRNNERGGIVESWSILYTLVLASLARPRALPKQPCPVGGIAICTALHYPLRQMIARLASQP